MSSFVSIAYQEDMLAKALAALDDDIRFVRVRKNEELGPINAIKEIGAHFKDGKWSVTPFPGMTGFGELGLKGSTGAVNHLRAQHG